MCAASADRRRGAVLFARRDSIYKQLPGCDVWDAQRDARTWPGGAPVVAHPPCAQWGQLRQFARVDPAQKALALFAVEAVRRCGGVLEHPRASRLWPEAGLPAPGLYPARDRWGGWSLGILQSDFGHRAAKPTRLYIVGVEPDELPTVPLVLGEATHAIGKTSRRPGARCRPRISKADREHTPEPLARWLVELARRVSR